MVYLITSDLAENDGTGSYTGMPQTYLVVSTTSMARSWMMKNVPVISYGHKPVKVEEASAPNQVKGVTKPSGMGATR
jgi:hypothetical protein